MFRTIRILTFLSTVVALLWPSAGWAQFSFAPGTYELANGSKGTASLKLVLAESGKPTTVVGVRNGKEHTFRSTEIVAFTIDSHRFVRVNYFRFRSGADTNFKDPIFLEVLETNPVELFYYYYLVEMGPNFKAHVKLPVLRKPSTNVFLAYSPNHTPGFDAKLASGTFVAALFPADPVLQRQLATNAINRAQLAAVVHAYNQGVRLKP